MARDREDFTSGQGSNPIASLMGIAGACIIVLVLIIGAFSSYYTVDQGQEGVITRNGAVIGHSGPGLHFKLPIIDSVEPIFTQPQKAQYGGDAGKVEAYSADQQPASLKFAVNWHVTDPEIFYGSYTTLDNAKTRVLDTKVFEIVKNIFGKFEAASAIQNRADLNAKTTTALQEATKGLSFRVDSFQMEDIAFSEKYEAAVEDRMEATVRQQQAEFAKAKRIIDADAGAYEVKAAADAKAHQITVQGNAEADAIKARGDALAAHPQLVELTIAEKWNGVAPTTVVPGSAMPFVHVGGDTSH